MDQKQLQFLDASKKWAWFLGTFGLYHLKQITHFGNKVSYAICPVKILFSISFIILYSTFFFFQLLYSDGIFYHRLHIKSLNFFIAFGSVPVAVLILLSSLLQSKSYGVLETNIVQCEFTFNKSSSDKINEKTVRLLLCFLFTTMISLTCDLLSLYYENWASGLILNLIASYICATYSIVSVLHFAIIQFWLYSSYFRINQDLVEYLKTNREYSRMVKKANLIHEEILNDFVPVEISKKINFDDNIFTRKRKGLKSTTEKVKDLRVKYNDVFKISRECDKIFSSRNLFVVASNLIISVILLFFTLQFVRQYLKDHEAVLGLDLISSFKGTFLCLSNIWWLVWTCGTTCKEARKTTLIIQDSIINVDDGDLKTELQEFSNQLLHENVCFSPHGFFVFENGMLLSILSAIASYLVILLQFHPIHYNIMQPSTEGVLSDM